MELNNDNNLLACLYIGTCPCANGGDFPLLKKFTHLLAVFSFVLMGTQFVHAHEISPEAAHVHISDDQSVSDHAHENGRGIVKPGLSAETPHGSEVHCGANLLAFASVSSVHFMRSRDGFLINLPYRMKIFTVAFELPPPRA